LDKTIETLENKELLIRNLKSFVDSKELSDRAFEQSIGWSNSFYGKVKANKVSFSIDKLTTILEKYPEINIHWLFTGKGNMLVGKYEEASIPANMGSLTSNIKKLESFIPPAASKIFESIQSEIYLLIEENQKHKKHVDKLLKSQKDALRKMEELFKL
jgi:hypothetical protein